MTNRIFTILIAFLLAATACRQQPKQHTVISQKASADSIAAFLKSRVNPLFLEHNTDASGKLLDSLQPVVEKLQYYPTTCTWLRFMGLQYMYEKKYDSSEAVLRKALLIAQEKDTSKKQIIAAETNLADLFLDQEKLDSALLYARDAYYLSHQTDTSNLPMVLLKLSGIYSRIGDMEQLRKYLAEGFAASNNAPKYKLAFASNIAQYYADVKKPDSAILFFRNFVEKDTSLNTPWYNSTRYENMGIILSRENRNEEALQYQLRALQMYRELGTLDAITLFNVGVTYHKLRQYEHATQFFDEAFQLAREQNDQEAITRIWRRRSMLLADQQRWAAALAAKDSAYENFELEVDSSLAVKARELETRYSVKAKDDEIKALAISNEANRKISGQQRTIIFTLTSLFVLVAVLGIVLWRRRKLAEKLRQTELEQRLLRSQMEPHFIFNTLSVLQSYIRNNESEKAVRYLNQFARLLRITLENSRESFVPLEEEITALENYLSLQSMRFEGLFDYSVDSWPMYEEDGLLIPPMLLQPFVENAILHGMKQLDHKGHIHVSIKKENHVLRCVIEDNGTGLQSATALQPGKTSLSTTITQERLAILSRETGYPAGITVANRPGEQAGTRVELSIPFRKAKPFSGSGEKSNGF